MDFEKFLAASGDRKIAIFIPKKLIKKTTKKLTLPCPPLLLVSWRITYGLTGCESNNHVSGGTTNKPRDIECISVFSNDCLSSLQKCGWIQVLQTPCFFEMITLHVFWNDSLVQFVISNPASDSCVLSDARLNHFWALNLQKCTKRGIFKGEIINCFKMFLKSAC